MKPILCLCLAAGLSAVGVAAGAQTPPPQGEVEILGPTKPEDWNSISRSATRAYLAEVNGIAQADGATTVRLARVLLKPADAADRGYSVDVFELKCPSRESRTTTAIEYGPDGAELERFEEASPWEAIRANSIDSTLHLIACEGQRAQPPTWPSIAAFMDAGRP